MVSAARQILSDRDMNASDNSSSVAPVKIVKLADLAVICAALRDAGRRVVHCHGVFDLLHVGHLRHFKVAKDAGDVLVVTITADAFVNKGPGRPAFPSELRAEMLSAMECIDYVAIVNEPSAEAAISAVRPSLYVKGGEYDKPERDITGKITSEQRLVESFGGNIKFTYDLTFSSSNLLNSHFSSFDSATRSYLDGLRGAGGEARIFDYIEKMQKLKIVMVGETIVDHYIYVAPMGKAPKENIIATLHQSEEFFAGGVIAAANHLTALCPDLEVVTCLGDGSQGENYEKLVRKNLRAKTPPTIISRPNGPTVRKTRFVEPTYVRKLFEVYHMDDSPLPAEVRDDFLEQLRAKVKDADLVIVYDFGHGFIDKTIVNMLSEEAKFLAINVQTNAGNLGYNLLTKYPRADFLCIDAMEARLVSQDKHVPLEEIVGKIIPSMIKCPHIIVTHGKNGCYALNEGSDEVMHIPAFRLDVVDTVGAGDAFFALAAPFAALGADSGLAGFVGNVAGAMKVGIVGHRESTQKLKLLRYITTLLK